MSAIETQPHVATSLDIGYDKKLMVFGGRAHPELAALGEAAEEGRQHHLVTAVKEEGAQQARGPQRVADAGFRRGRIVAGDVLFYVGRNLDSVLIGAFAVAPTSSFSCGSASGSAARPGSAGRGAISGA